MREINSVFGKYGYFWVTLGLFLFSLVGHWIFAWQAYIDEQEAHQQPIEVSSYVVETTRDTFENWQSEFLQLIWQVAGLAYLLHVGSPQSKEGDERKEEKLDALIKLVDKQNGEELIKKLDKKYVRL
jgi:hypothetical protein